MAEYGATPWYTEAISSGAKPLKFALDSGSNFIWATSDLCSTPACNTHDKLNTSQQGFSWLNIQPTVRSFGPWGSMTTLTGEIELAGKPTANSLAGLPLFASTQYHRDQFKYLAWDGGIGFPSRSDTVQSGSGFYLGQLLDAGVITKASFSLITETANKTGSFYLGGEDPGRYNAASRITLPPDTSGNISYIWGTRLYSAYLQQPGDLPSLNNARFYLDTGSSVFKGDAIYLQAILQKLLSITDAQGQPVFEKLLNPQGQWTGLAYRNSKGPQDYPGLLPDFTLVMGSSCNAIEGQSAHITLSPDQYSIYIEKGSNSGQWQLAFTVLDGIGGLLVGSTFLDLFYTSFNYAQDSNGLTQGNIYLYTKTSGSSPSALSCSSAPPPSPVTGVWFNSYCSQMLLSADSNSGVVSGSYTSHTGSTGTAAVSGWMGRANGSSDNGYGIPLALGIAWRLNNQSVAQRDATWHWVSSFSGQYHPAQTVSESGQADYALPETITIMNALVATANLKGYTESAPVMWPQTLSFTRNPPAYCQPIPPTTALHYTGSATDYISGVWSDGKATMQLLADMQSGQITGSFISASGQRYTISGSADILPLDTEVVEQGLALNLHATDGSVLSLAGGVNWNTSPNSLNLWQNDLNSTTWTGRFTESTLSQSQWWKQQ